MRKQALSANSTPPTLSTHRDSRAITKVRPKIRVIHIFAPEIIKTDVDNFRELVQSLTGKPTVHNRFAGSGKRRHQKVPTEKPVEDPGSTMNLDSKPLMITQKMEPLNSLTCDTSRHEDDFSEIDCFIQDISELPLLPMDPSHQIHSSFEASQLA